MCLLQELTQSKFEYQIKFHFEFWTFHLDDRLLKLDSHEIHFVIMNVTIGTFGKKASTVFTESYKCQLSVQCNMSQGTTTASFR